MKKTYLLVTFLLIFFLGFGAKAAGNFEIDLDIIKQDVHPEENAQYKIRVTNNYNQPQSFIVYTQSMNPGWEYLEDYLLYINPNSTKSTSLYITPSKETTAGRRGFSIYVYPKSKPNNTLSKNTFIEVVRDKKLIFLSLSTSKSNYEPEGEVKVFTSVKNVGKKDLSEYKVNFSLENKTKVSNVPLLESGSSAELQASFKLGKYSQGEYKIKANILTSEGKIEDKIDAKFNVPGSEEFLRDSKISDNFLWKDIELRIRNIGNVKSKIEYLKAEIPSYMEPLISKGREPNEIVDKDGKKIYKWAVTDLSPGESASVKYRINYWIIIAITGLIILVASFAYLELKVATITKKTRKADSEHSVNILIENNTGGTVENAKVKDFIPGIAKLIEKFDSVRPNSIKKKEEGTELTWELGKLGPGEERVLTYRIKPVVQVEGFIKLPRAELTYETKRGEKEAVSHRANANFE